MAPSRRKQKKSFLGKLMDAPWQVSIAVGVAVFIVLEWILPSLVAGSIILESIAYGISAVAWVFYGLFFLIGAIVFALAASSRSKQGKLKAVKGATGGSSVARRRQPASSTVASQARLEPAATESPSVELNPFVQRGAPEEPLDTSGVGEEPSSDMVTKPTEWSIDVINEVEWKRFEDVCQKFYETSGIRSETTALGPDGGMDILLYQDDTGKPTAIVQCETWGERPVGVKPVRELLGAMTHEKIGKAFFMTSGQFSDDAKVVANSNRITLIGGEMLLMMIRRLPEAAQKSLLEFATEGDYKVPTCPSCGIKMKRVSGTAGRSDFWGCHNYPRCRQKLGMRREVSRQLEDD